jgi:uncharacterized protein (TIRG00374 family)
MRFTRTARHVAIGLFIAAIALFLTYSKIDTTEVSATLSESDWPLLLLVPLPLALSYIFRIVRWRILLTPMGKVSSRQAAGPLLAGFMINSLVPARAGEVVRALLLSRKTGISRSSSLATVVLARLFDGLTLTGMALVALTFLWSQIQPEVRAGLIAAGGLYLLVLAAFVLLRLRRRSAMRLLLWPFRRAGVHFREKLERALDSFADGLAVLQSGRELLQVIIATIGVWSMIVLSVVPALYALRLPFLWYYPVLVIILAALGMLIPTPAGTGTIHAALVFALPVLTTLSSSESGLLALVFHLTQFLPVILVGIIAAVSEGVSTRDIEQVERDGERAELRDAPRQNDAASHPGAGHGRQM